MEEDPSGSLSNYRLLNQHDSQFHFGASVARAKKLCRHACLSALILNTFASAVSAQILINEVDTDQQGTDNAEFVELFDGGSGNTDLSGLVLVFFNGHTDTAYRTFDLDGFSTNRMGYFVLCGNRESVPNCDNDISPDTKTNLIQNGADAIALYTGDKTEFPRGTTLTTTKLIDAIVYDTSDSDDTGLLTLLLPNQPQVSEGTAKTATQHSNQRCPNGSGGARKTDTYDQFPPTPGTENTCTTTVNVLPVANAGNDRSVAATDSVMLDGSGSMDSDGTITSYAWTQDSGTTVSLTNADTAQATFSASDAADAGEDLVFMLTVTDNDGAMHTNTVTINIYSANEGLPAGETIAGGEVATKQLYEAILTHLVQVAVANVASSVESRADAVFSDAPQGAIYQLNGQTVQLDDQSRLSTNLQDTLQRQLPAYIKSLKGDGMDWKQMVSDSSFVLPLNATDNGGAGDSELTIWGNGDYTKLSSKGTNLDWEGDVFGIQLGVDNRVRNNLLFGGLVSWSKGDVNYALNDDKGDYRHTLTSVHPYMAWSNGGINVWGNVGYGQGKLEIDQTGSDKRIHDTHLLSLTAGAKGQLLVGGRLKSDITLLQIRIDESADGNIDAETLSSQQFRLILESEQQYALASGGTVTPALEIGARYDVGDGDTGLGMVLGAGLRYANTTGLTVEGKINTLLGRKNYKEWGISGTISQRARADGRGFAFSLSPSYGDTGSNANQIWQGISEGNDDGNDNSDDYSARLNIHMSYGVFAPGGRGLLTPYSEITIGDTQNYRLGITWKRDSLFDIHLSGEREESSSGTNNNKVLLECTIRF